MLDGMPEPVDLRCVEADGHRVITVGSRVLFYFQVTDVGMRNVAVVTLRSLGFTGRRVAAVLGLSEEYVATLRSRAARQGSAGVLRVSGRPGKLCAAQLAKARQWHAEGASNVEIGRRLGVHNSTVSRALAAAGASPRPVAKQVELPLPAQLEPEPEPQPQPQPQPQPEPEPEPQPEPELEAGLGWAGTARVVEGRFVSRYAGAMLLHAFTDLVGAADVFAQAAGRRGARRFDDVALLSGMYTVFGLGFASVEQAKYPDRAQVGPVAGLRVLPQLRTLRPRLASIADGCDPLRLQRAFATAMLRADPCTSGVYFVDEHFMPYSGALPVGKGWNTKRRHAQAGRVDTMIADAAGRAVCFTTGEPAGLSTSLPGTLAELRAITGDDAKIMLGFDRGGAYPAVFTTCRDAHVDWITYRRGKAATPTALPIRQQLTRGDQPPVTVVYADELVTLKDYGTARQLTLFEHGTPVLQILTSDTHSCAGALIWFIRARWRIENLFKYLDFYGIDYLADYTATIHTNARLVDNPARKTARAELNALHAERDTQRQTIGALHTDRQLSIAALNRALTTAQQRIHKLDKKIEAAEQELKSIPAKLPANIIDPDAQRAVHRANRRGLQMVLRLLAANAEHWLAHRLNAYLQDHDEYRATTRNLLHLGGTITYTPTSIHAQLDRPNTPRLTRALALLLDEINTNPPHLPADPRPITYTLTA
jgi:transposase